MRSTSRHRQDVFTCDRLLRDERVERRCELEAREAARGVERVAVEGNKASL
jgi:hypothetical protein